MKPEDGERTNVLLLGIDARKGEKDSRTDTIILASVDPKLKKAIILSIPRDTRVKLRGSTNQKINAANVYGGPELVRSTVEELRWSAPFSREIGDCIRPANITKAVYEGYHAALDI